MGSQYPYPPQGLYVPQPNYTPLTSPSTYPTHVPPNSYFPPPPPPQTPFPPPPPQTYWGTMGSQPPPGPSRQNSYVYPISHSGITPESRSPEASGSSGFGVGSVAGKAEQGRKPLRRFNACHNCRRKKLKCDSTRPHCTPCQKQYEAEVASLPAGSTTAPHISCSYDDVEEAWQKERARRAVTTGRKSKTTELQERIEQLEAQLQDQAAANVQAQADLARMRQYQASTSSTSTSFPGISQVDQSGFPGAYQSGHRPITSVGTSLPPIPRFSQQPMSATPASMLPGQPTPEPLAYPGSTNFDTYSMAGTGVLPTPTVESGIPVWPAPMQTLDTAFAFSDGSSKAALPVPPSHQGSVSSADGFQLISSGYSVSLPPIDVVRFLVKAFFSTNDYVTKIFDQRAFMARLFLPPDHRDFPYVGTLHAICAAASYLTTVKAETRSPPSAMTNAGIGSDIATREALYDSLDTGSVAFRAKHEKLATDCIDISMDYTHPLVEMIQAMIVLGFHWTHEAKMTKAWMQPASDMRLGQILGIDQERTREAAATMAPNQMRSQDMMWWISVVGDTMATSMTGWSPAFAESETTCPLPTREGPNGEYLQASQYLTSPDLLIHHPFEHFDSTIVMIKGMIVLGRAQTFIRAVNRNPTNALNLLQPFMQHRHDIDNFLVNVPRALRKIFKPNGFDLDMLICLCAGYLAVIQLNDILPLIDPSQSKNQPGSSAAATGIMALVETLLGSSLDLKILPMFTSFCFFQASKVLVADLGQATESADVETYMYLNNGLSTMKLMMTSLGERFSQMYSLVEGVQQQYLRDSRMTEMAKTYEQVVRKQAPGAVIPNPTILNPSPHSYINDSQPTLPPHNNGDLSLHPHSQPHHPYPTQTLPHPQPDGNDLIYPSMPTDFSLLSNDAHDNGSGDRVDGMPLNDMINPIQYEYTPTPGPSSMSGGSGRPSVSVSHLGIDQAGYGDGGYGHMP